MIEIVDAQIHPPEPVAEWPFAESRIALSCELAREAMDSVGVDAALVLTGDVRYGEYAVRTYPDRFACCLTIDPDRPDVADFVAGYRSVPGMRALRVIARSWTDGELTAAFAEGRYEPALAAAEKHGVPVFIQAAGHRKALEQVVRAHPDLLFVLDHAGLNQQPTVVADDPWAQVPDAHSANLIDIVPIAWIIPAVEFEPASPSDNRGTKLSPVSSNCPPTCRG